jgi:propanol-preferring alcohol dehydrogenase
LGAEVTAVDIQDDKLALAQSLGATTTLNAARDNVIKAMRSAGRAHVALVTSASKAAYDTAFYCVRPSGVLLVVGLPAQDLTFPAIVMAGGEIRIQATATGTCQDLREILALGAAGKVHCQVTTRPVDQVNGVLDQLRRGVALGRVVLRMDA